MVSYLITSSSEEVGFILTKRLDNGAILRQACANSCIKLLVRTDACDIRGIACRPCNFCCYATQLHFLSANSSESKSCSAILGIVTVKQLFAAALVVLG